MAIVLILLALFGFVLSGTGAGSSSTSESATATAPPRVAPASAGRTHASCVRLTRIKGAATQSRPCRTPARP